MKINARRGAAAFTLIELMAVITIIVILAGLVVGGMGFVNDRQSKEKAKVQIGMLSNELENYKLDNGFYPPTVDSADGTNNSKLLFDALYFQGANDPTNTAKIYIGQLDPATNKQGWTHGTASATTKIMDPWGNEYRYRSGTNASGDPNISTQNPGFDLWSCGKDGLTNPESPSDKKNRDDIKNF